MLLHILVFLLAILSALLLTPVAKKIAVRWEVVDRPNARKVHLTPTPLLGGLAIYAAAIIAIVLYAAGVKEQDPKAWREILGMVGGATLLLVVGVWDDRGRMHSQWKLLIAMPLAAIILAISGIRVTAWPPLSFLPDLSSFALLLSFGLTIAWVVAITAAFSILDYMDGLCSGVAAVASAFFFIAAVTHGQILVATLSAAMLGATLGFLRWNFNPAKIFMGDCGAMFIGFMMALIGIKLRFPELPEASSWMIPVLILGVPLFDAALVTISRARRGLMPFSTPGKDHSAHRLANLGLGHRSAVLMMYGMGIALGLLALLVTRLSVAEAYVLGGAVLVVGLLAIVLLEQLPYSRAMVKEREEQAPRVVIASE